MNIKSVPKKAAKVVVHEAFETLKRAREQVTATGEYAQTKEDKPQEEKKAPEAKASEEAKAREQRHFEAYKAELRDLSAQSQKEEQVKKQQENLQSQEEAGLPKEPPPQVSSVPSRGKGKLSNLKKKISDLGKFVEVRKPPSG